MSFKTHQGTNGKWGIRHVVGDSHQITVAYAIDERWARAIVAALNSLLRVSDAMVPMAPRCPTCNDAGLIEGEQDGCPTCGKTVREG